MKNFITSILLAVTAAAAPAIVQNPAAANAVATSTSVAAAAYTAAINPGSSDPPPLWDPPAPLPPPLFEAPKEDQPVVPAWRISVLEAPVQSVRVEKLAPFTPGNVQPIDNIYAPSAKDDEGKFVGEGSLRPAPRTLGQCFMGFMRTWIWWISVVVLAAGLVYVAEKMLIGSVRAARKARSASRVARSRAASLMQGTRSRAASLLGDGGRARAGTMKEKAPVTFEQSRSPPSRSRSWDESMV